MAEPATADQPWPVRAVAVRLNDWINKLGTVWVEGQVTQLNSGRGNTVFFTLRDPSAEVSLSASCSRALAAELTEG
ncbi:MAG: exodeoxyribonuclease VII large subunit, partial [Actinomycetota bacterium]|nr:exodeoxyribonuclease VII large subunit [Actinomycetota bacterium]